MQLPLFLNALLVEKYFPQVKLVLFCMTNGCELKNTSERSGRDISSGVLYLESLKLVT